MEKDQKKKKAIHISNHEQQFSTWRVFLVLWLHMSFKVNIRLNS